MIVITILLAATLSVMITGLLEPRDSPPAAQLELETTDCNYTLVHQSGDALHANHTEIQGVNDSAPLGGKRLTAGTRQELEPVDDEIRVVWKGEADDTQVIARFDVEDTRSNCDSTTDVSGSDSTTGGEVYTYSGGNVESITANGTTTPLNATDDAQALGSVEHDITDDGRGDLPFVNSSGAVLATNGTNESTTVADSSDIDGNIEDSKTRVSSGTWNGSDTSVFFVNENHDTIYRATPSTAPETVATPGNGAQAISGIGDINGDGTDELVFADGSQQLRYLDPDGNIHKLQDGGAGQNNGIGAGSLADFNGDGTESVVFIDGSNNVKITNADGSTTTFSTTSAKKAPPTTGDIDDDGNQEIIYVGSDDGYLKYIDDVGGENNVAFLNDDDGNKIAGSDTTGVT